mgnify:CR=1 FL=1
MCSVKLCLVPKNESAKKIKNPGNSYIGPHDQYISLLPDIPWIKDRDEAAKDFDGRKNTEALIRAAHRGVRITLVADYKNNLVDDKSGKPRAAFAALKSAGADVRTIKAFAIHHDKVIIANRKTVELGSFNYSSAAAQRNSENVLVHWNNPELASVYLKHFERNYGLSEAFSAAY